MNSSEFITNEESEKKLIPYLNTIKKECQPFLQHWGDFPLMRGVKSPSKTFIKKKVRLTNRRPKDTPYHLHNKFNKAFQVRFNISYRNSMFASGDRGIAADYGKPYMVFPIGDFDYIWSKDIDDLFGKWQQVEPNWGTQGTTEADQQKEVYRAEDEFINKVVHTYQSTELDLAIRSDHEIMIRVPSYYGINENAFVMHEQFIIGYLNEQ